MIDIVFISDLHLHPEDTDINDRFDAFIDWAKVSVKKIYILGDFFHAWVGDDDMDDWSLSIAKKLRSLKNQGIELFYMHGNRDFLLGLTFAKLAGWQMVYEPTLIQLGSEKALLMHGDSYCTKDINHQRFRIATRNKLFPILFLLLPLAFRKKMVNKVRQKSMQNISKTKEQMDVVENSVVQHMVKHSCSLLIHGHTHKYGLSTYFHQGRRLMRYVLSDWNDNPQILCYDYTKGVYYTKM